MMMIFDLFIFLYILSLLKKKKIIKTKPKMQILTKQSNNILKSNYMNFLPLYLTKSFHQQ
jgi:hypothetical protein